MTVQEEIEKSFKLLNQDYSDIKTFAGVTPVYPFNTEDSANLFFSYKDFIKDKKVLTVTGSGDALLDLIVAGSRDITCFDTNVLAKRIAELKLSFWKAHLGSDAYKRFFAGEHCGDEILDYDLFKECRNYLSPETLYYFECVYEYARKKGIKLTNHVSQILYQQYESFLHFPNQNQTLDNPSSYLSEWNAKKLEDALIDTEDLHVRFIDSDILSLAKESLDPEYYFIFLSNIFEFTSTFIPKKRLRMRLETFKDYVVKELYPHVSDGGVLVAGYLKGSRNVTDDIYHDKSKYDLIFSEDEGFLIDDIYGCKGKAIIKANEKVIKKRKLDMYDFF